MTDVHNSAIAAENEHLSTLRTHFIHHGALLQHLRGMAAPLLDAVLVLTPASEQAALCEQCTPLFGNVQISEPKQRHVEVLTDEKSVHGSASIDGFNVTEAELDVRLASLNKAKPVRAQLNSAYTIGQVKRAHDAARRALDELTGLHAALGASTAAVFGGAGSDRFASDDNLRLQRMMKSIAVVVTYVQDAVHELESPPPLSMQRITHFASSPPAHFEPALPPELFVDLSVVQGSFRLRVVHFNVQFSAVSEASKSKKRVLSGASATTTSAAAAAAVASGGAAKQPTWLEILSDESCASPFVPWRAAHSLLEMALGAAQQTNATLSCLCIDVPVLQCRDFLPPEEVYTPPKIQPTERMTNARDYMAMRKQRMNERKLT